MEGKKKSLYWGKVTAFVRDKLSTEVEPENQGEALNPTKVHCGLMEC